MEITFSMGAFSQSITETDLDFFQNSIVNQVLPNDYRQHMLTYNGGDVNETIYNINFPEGGGIISDLYPIKYGKQTIESVNNNIKHALPQGYLSIGMNTGGGQIIMSLNDENYGFIKEWYADGSMVDLSSSFTELLNSMKIDDE